MSYIRQDFTDGQVLEAKHLKLMEDGIINAEKLAIERAAGAANMEKGTGALATQQVPRSGDEHDNKVSQKEGETEPRFDFTGHADAGMAGRVQYGAVGNYSVSLNGRSAALNKHATAIGNSTVAKGEESFAQGYETIAEGDSSFAGGSRTWAQGEASVALGNQTRAQGKYSFAQGVLTYADKDWEAVFGCLNNTSVDDDIIFSVGSPLVEDKQRAGVREDAASLINLYYADKNKGYIKITETNADYVWNNESITQVFIPSNAFMVCGDGRVKVRNGWVQENNDVVVKSTMDRTLDTFAKNLQIALDPYLVLESEREDKTSVQMLDCTASGLYSVALGRDAVADKDYAIAIGKSVSAKAPYALAMGVDSQATNEADFAAGVNARANGAHSRAFGTNVNAGHVYQTVIGKNNDNKEGTLFEIGNGADTEHRGNAFEVYTEGDVAIRYNGQMYSLQKILEALSGFIDDAKM